MAWISTHYLLPRHPTPDEVNEAVAMILPDLLRWGVDPAAIEWKVRSWNHMPGKTQSPTSGIVYALAAGAEFTPAARTRG